jgi:hypothetical protein
MSAAPIILSGITPEQLAEAIQPALRSIVREELTQILDKQEDRFLSPKEVCERFIP